MMKKCVYLRTVSVIAIFIVLFVAIFSADFAYAGTTKKSVGSWSCYTQYSKMIEQSDGSFVADVDTTYTNFGESAGITYYETVWYNKRGEETKRTDRKNPREWGNVNKKDDGPRNGIARYEDTSIEKFYLNGASSFVGEFYWETEDGYEYLDTLLIEYDSRGRESNRETHSYMWNNRGEKVEIGNNCDYRNDWGWNDRNNSGKNSNYSNYNNSSSWNEWSEWHDWNKWDNSNSNQNNSNSNYNNRNNNSNYNYNNSSGWNYTSSEYSYYHSWQTFSDVYSNSWYHDFVEASVDRGLMRGLGNGCFDPDAALTRAQVAQLVYNMSGNLPFNACSYHSYSDIYGSDWFCQTVYNTVGMIGEDAGVTLWSNPSGQVIDATFAPNAPATRLYLVWALNEVLARGGLSYTGQKTNVQFNDLGNLHYTVQNAINGLAQAGVINGVGNNQFDPYGTLTRGQAAKILTIFYDRYHPVMRQY